MPIRYVLTACQFSELLSLVPNNPEYLKLLMFCCAEQYPFESEVHGRSVKRWHSLEKNMQKSEFRELWCSSLPYIIALIENKNLRLSLNQNALPRLHLNETLEFRPTCILLFYSKNNSWVHLKAM